MPTQSSFKGRLNKGDRGVYDRIVKRQVRGPGAAKAA